MVLSKGPLPACRLYHSGSTDDHVEAFGGLHGVAMIRTAKEMSSLCIPDRDRCGAASLHAGSTLQSGLHLSRATIQECSRMLGQRSRLPEISAHTVYIQSRVKTATPRCHVTTSRSLPWQDTEKAALRHGACKALQPPAHASVGLALCRRSPT